MNKITRQMIEEGYQKGFVWLINNPNDGCISAQIGDNWFYFAGNENDELTVENYKEVYTSEEIVDYIFNVLDSDFKTEFEDEYLYYYCFLLEKLRRTNTMTKQITLNPVKTKFGMISIETLMYPRSEEDRIKIYDSDDKYFDYFSVETLCNSACEMETTIEEEYAARLKAFREADTFEDLVLLLTTDYIKTTDNPLELERELNTTVSDNDYVNRIGNHYVLMKE